MLAFYIIIATIKDTLKTGIKRVLYFGMDDCMFTLQTVNFPLWNALATNIVCTLYTFEAGLAT